MATVYIILFQSNICCDGQSMSSTTRKLNWISSCILIVWDIDWNIARLCMHHIRPHAPIPKWYSSLWQASEINHNYGNRHWKNYINRVTKLRRICHVTVAILLCESHHWGAQMFEQNLVSSFVSCFDVTNLLFCEHSWFPVWGYIEHKCRFLWVKFYNTFLYNLSLCDRYNETLLN